MKIFKNNELQRIYEDSLSIIDDHLKLLDEISEDIKTLEGVLKKSASPMFMYEFKEGFLSFYDGRIRFSFNGDSITLMRPLLEQSVNVRLFMSKHIPDFFAKWQLEICKNKKNVEAST